MASIQDLLLDAFGRIDRIDARVVLSHILNKPKEYFIMHPETEVHADEEQRFREAVDKIADGCPVPYITGLQSFWGYDFSVTPDVLIPRPDTETLIEEALALRPAPKTILDMGTGSGCIAITLALNILHSQVCACDVSPKALAVARGNANRFNAHNVCFFESNWFDAFAGKTFDLIVSNPPYIEPDDAHLKSLTYEPISALTDHVDGLSDIRQIVNAAPAFLNSHGTLMIEHGYNQGESVRNIFLLAGFKDIETICDLGGNERITRGHLG